MITCECDNIYNCNCIEGMKRLSAGCVDLVVTSPPYDNLRSYGGGVIANGLLTFLRLRPMR